MSFNLSCTAQDLNTAVTKANAAAPQSTTYTKSETNKLLKKAWLLDGATGIANGTDLNTLITPGNYFHASSGVDTLGNIPEQVAFRLYVALETNVDNFIEQIFNPISSPKEYRRYYRVNTWSDWVLVNDNLAAKADTATTYTKTEIDSMIGSINTVLEEVL